jgi:hypothetical protein
MSSPAVKHLSCPRNGGHRFDADGACRIGRLLGRETDQFCSVKTVRDKHARGEQTSS